MPNTAQQTSFVSFNARGWLEVSCVGFYGMSLRIRRIDGVVFPLIGLRENWRTTMTSRRYGPTGNNVVNVFLLCPSPNLNVLLLVQISRKK